MNSKGAMQKLRSLYKLSAQHIPASVSRQRNRETIQLISILTEKDHSSLSDNIKEWLIGFTNPNT
jgi:hypothetical protein